MQKKTIISLENEKYISWNLTENKKYREDINGKLHLECETLSYSRRAETGESLEEILKLLPDAIVDLSINRSGVMSFRIKYDDLLPEDIFWADERDDDSCFIYDGMPIEQLIEKDFEFCKWYINWYDDAINSNYILNHPLYIQKLNEFNKKVEESWQLAIKNKKQLLEI